MNLININELESIDQKIVNYYQIIFENEEDDFVFNKKLKNEIKDFIIENNKEKEKVKEAIYLLAKHTGCAEDGEISEEILDDLVEKKFISDDDIDFFYDNSKLKRWE